MNPKSTPVFVVLVLFAALVVGCGGSDDSTVAVSDGSTLAKSDSGPPSKAEFVKRANEVCEESRATRYDEAKKYRLVHEKEIEPLAPIPTEEKIIRSIALPSVLKLAKELDALEAPTGDEKTLRKIVTGIEAGVRKAEENPYSISFEVPGEYPFLKVNNVIFNYGLSSCRNPA